MITKRLKPKEKLKITPSKALLSGKPCWFGDPEFRINAEKQYREIQNKKGRIKNALSDKGHNPELDMTDYDI